MGNPEFKDMTPTNQKGWLEWKDDLKKFREYRASIGEWYTLNHYFDMKRRGKL